MRLFENCEQIREIAAFQREIDFLKEEKFLMITNEICDEFESNKGLWQSIIKMAAHLHPKHGPLYENLVAKLLICQKHFCIKA
jgi:hypothetical protein